MTALADLTESLDRLVADGALQGWAAGVREAGTTHLTAGGRRTADEPAAIASNTKPIAGALTLRLVELGRLGLDDAVAQWLPELANPRVLTRPGGPLDDTVAAQRPITVRHLLTMTAGFGWVVEGGPLAAAMDELQVGPGPDAPPMTPDEYLRRLASLPLAGQPGATWRYHTSSDVLGVLLARCTGRPVSDLLAEHVTGPLAMPATHFPTDVAFESLATGLVSTVADQLRFLAAIGDGGGAVLGRASTRQMCTNQLTPEQRSGADDLLEAGAGWGHHVEVRADGLVGWAGGRGTIGYVDPAGGRAAALFTWQGMDTAGTQQAFAEFWQLFG
ncbi:serine hydrolase domain-containing protein [Nocardioides massiliensis]|uniref:CubicO group peptidase (Beta-lactamase class C family) n=1 Tax=Nocardioides massiliensis TaxID=1325935 RepID=A0ABT9NJU6_9ACTN|nr:serine hydrolase domain-containing protein [Nocardioides massiliensis]MDP9820686.1 CubicO group peptidase (beta-lactamase class C family) [Nocardioides massiliensis]